MNVKFTVYSSVHSQWAGVIDLTLASKGFTKDEYCTQEINFMLAANFDPAYLKVNHNGTVPALTSSDLDKPLTESTDILRYLDSLRPLVNRLVPSASDGRSKQTVDDILNLVHSDEMHTNLIFLRARDCEEMQVKKGGPWKEFLALRQTRLEMELAADPGHPLFEATSKRNSDLLSLYNAEIGPEHDDFFKTTDQMYHTFAAGMKKLDTLLVLPFATGDAISEADWHVVPWLSHAMVGAGSEPHDLHNFQPLERLIKKSVPDFRMGLRIQEWWDNVTKTEPFRKVFPTLH